MYLNPSSKKGEYLTSYKVNCGVLCTLEYCLHRHMVPV